MDVNINSISKSDGLTGICPYEGFDVDSSVINTTVTGDSDWGYGLYIHSVNSKSTINDSQIVNYTDGATLYGIDIAGKIDLTENSSLVGVSAKNIGAHFNNVKADIGEGCNLTFAGVNAFASRTEDLEPEDYSSITLEHGAAVSFIGEQHCVNFTDVCDLIFGTDWGEAVYTVGALDLTLIRRTDLIISRIFMAKSLISTRKTRICRQ